MSQIALQYIAAKYIRVYECSNVVALCFIIQIASIITIPCHLIEQPHLQFEIWNWDMHSTSQTTAQSISKM